MSLYSQIMKGKSMPKVATQQAVDAAADELLKEFGYDIEQVIPNRVAKKLGLSKANGGIGDKFDNWKERRIQEGVPFMAKAPPEFDASLDVTFENFRRLAKGLFGKYRAQDDKVHEEKIDKWSDRFDILESKHNQLQHKLDHAEERCREMMDENDRLTTRLAQSRSELGKAEAGLEVARDLNDKLLAKLGLGSDPAADVTLVPDADVVSVGVDIIDEGTPSPTRKRGRPRKDSIRSSSGSKAQSEADDLLAGTPWEEGRPDSDDGNEE
jgi:hypothetical protein